MPKTVTFHIGLPKTGTTTIQHYLRKNEEKLRSIGFLYPGAKEHPAMGSDKHLMILSAMLGNEPPKSGGMTAEECRRAVENIFENFRSSRFDNMILSHEGISTRALALDGNYMRLLVGDLHVRVVFCVRYLDDWMESLFKERIRAQGGPGTGRKQKRKPKLAPKPLLPIAPLSGANGKQRKSMLEEAAETRRYVGALREAWPSVEIVARSYDADREKRQVVSGALAAMGMAMDGGFPDPDDGANVRNPTKSNLSSMLIYHLVRGGADPDVVRAVTLATKARDRKGGQFAPLADRSFRFLSEEDIIVARSYYEDLRQEFLDLPIQPPYAPDLAERSLPRNDGMALLDWLRPDISDAVFEEACAAYLDPC